MNPSKDSPLNVTVFNGQLTISIGVNTLAYALQNGPEPFGATIIDNEAFVREMAIKLNDDGSEGDTALQKLLTDTANLVVESGSPNVFLEDPNISYD